MKTISFIFSTLLLFHLDASAQVDKKAKDILDKLSAKTKAYSSIRADFSYSLVNKDRKINTTQNWKLMIKGDKYRLEMGDQIIMSDGKSLWKVLKNDKEVELSNVSNAGDAFNPKNMFTIYEKGYKYKYVKEEKNGNKIAHLIDLFPENPKEKEFSSIRLYIDKTSLQIQRSEIKGKNGNVYTYIIKTFKTNETIDQNMFSYRASDFPGYELNDIR